MRSTLKFHTIVFSILAGFLIFPEAGFAQLLLPDLFATAGTDVRISPTTVEAGDVVSVTGTITFGNRGTAPTPLKTSFTMGVYLSLSSPYDGRGIALSEATVTTPMAAETSTTVPGTLRLTIPVSVRPAAYYLYYVMDSGNQVTESNEANNAALLGQIRVTAPMPDLWISSGTPTATPATVAPGDSIQLSAWTVTNRGSAAAAGFSNGFYLSSDPTITTSALYLTGNTNSTGLAAGASYLWGAPTFAIPAGTAPGNYYLGILVDKDGAVTESDESNNFVSVPITVALNSLPDLTVSVTNPVIKPATVEPGGSISISGTVVLTNQGEASASAFHVAAYLSGAVFDLRSTVLLYETTSLALRAGQSVSLPLSATATLPRLTVGRYVIYIVADNQSEVQESNENNNRATLGTLAVELPQKPDLWISSGAPTATPASVAAGGTIQLSSWTVSNRGSGSSESFSNGFYLSSDAVISTADLYLTGNSNVGMAAGESFVWGGPTLSIPADVAPGSYYIGILVDKDGQVAESDETNNTVATPITITPPPSDLSLTLSRTAIRPSAVEPGGTVAITGDATLTNLGPAPAPPFHIAAYLSGPVFDLRGAVLLYEAALPGMKVGQSSTVSMAWEFVMPKVADGTYVIWVLADNRREVVETNETNNRGTVGRIAVGAVKPDLWVPSGAPAITPGAVAAGDTLLLSSWTVNNRGTGSAGAFSNGIYLSQDSVITSADTLLLSNSNTGLASGDSYTWAESKVTIPPATAPGKYYLGILVDKDNAVVESDEGNNAVSALVTVSARCAPSISPGSRFHSAAAERGSINVTAAAGCPWVAATSQKWLLIVDAGPGTGSGTILYSVEPNTATESRTGTITVGDQIFTVVQAGSSCTYALSPAGRSHTYAAETGSIAVATATGCAWTAATADSWITISAGNTGSGPGQVQYSVQGNRAASARRGSIQVGGQTFTIDQDGAPAILISSISPASIVAGSAGFTLTVNGTNFASGISAICWNGVRHDTTFVSAGTLTAAIDAVSLAFPGTASITVVNSAISGTMVSNAVPFTINSPVSPTPVVYSLAPASAVAGSPEMELQVYGSNFLPESVIRWNGTPKFTVFLSSRQLRASIPASDLTGAGLAGVTVMNPGAVASNTVNFAVYGPAPVITALSPPVVPVGSKDFTLTVYGTNFGSGASVEWNGVARPTAFVSASVLTASIPAADAATVGKASITVQNTDGSESMPHLLPIVNLAGKPNITSLIPEIISAGGPPFGLTIRGSGFLANCIVQWNGFDRKTRFISATEVQADILASDIQQPGIFSVVVNNPAGFAEAETGDLGAGSQGLSTVTTPVPLVTRLGPVSVVAGSGGFRLSIEGYGFVRGTTYVQWNDRKVLGDFVSSSQVSVEIPSEDVASEGVLSFSVLNPPPGGGVSESQAFTITSKKSAMTQLFYPRLMSSAVANATENTGIAIANLSSKSAEITIHAFGKDGKEIAGPRITNPVSLSIAGVEQRAITESQVFGPGMPEQNAVGWMKLESSEAKVAGFFLVFDNTLSTLDGADVSSSLTTSFIFPELEKNGFNQFHIANPNNAVASARFELYKQDGTPRTSGVTKSISPSGALAEYFTDLFPGIEAESSDYLRVTSDQGLVPFSYLGLPGRDAMGLNGQDMADGAMTLYSPQYVVGGADWSTTLSVVNLDSWATTVTLRLIGDDGSQIGPTQVRQVAGKGKLFISEQEFFVSSETLTQGYIEIKSSGARLTGSLIFGDPRHLKYSAALPLVADLQSSVVFGQVASGMVGDKAYFTGVAMLNPSDADAHVTIELYDRSGRLVTSSNEIIPARRRKSKLLTEYFPDLTGQNVGSGYIKVTADRGLASFALFGSMEALSAVPAQIVP
jgi:subtilase family serine protease